MTDITGLVIALAGLVLLIEQKRSTGSTVERKGKYFNNILTYYRGN